MTVITCLRPVARQLFMALTILYGATHAAHAGTVSFEKLTWTEIQAQIQNGTDTIIVPVGGTEQSGPYIAVGKHNIRAQVQAERIAGRLGHALVAPVIAYVPEGTTTPRSSHMRFAGTISIPPAVFEGVIEGAGESFHVQGFRHVIFIADHGGYLSYLKSAVAKLNNKWRGQGDALYLAAYYDSIGGAFADTLRQRGYGAALGKHADLSDTALMLAIDPTMVRLDALKAAPLPGIAQGVYGGDPRPATAALGQIGTEIQVQAALRALGKAR